ncbi:MAG: imelysin family protein, partial [Flavobacteriales bacterium]|nr:imelysin family protein [Flavobacteriales bacterium]
DTAQIENNIANGSYNLAAATNLDAKGLPALDYLLSSPNAFNKLSETNRLQYFEDVFDDMFNTISSVLTDWSNYESSFTSDIDNAAGSPISLIVNQLNFDLELLKNARIGIPLGKKTLNIAQPKQVEAYYSQWSLELTRTHLTALKSHFEGQSGQGLDDYLNFLEAKHGETLLATAILDQIAVIEGKLNPISDPLSDRVTDQTTDLDEVYNEIQKLVVLTKTDMPSALGVLITYQDNDGD